MYDRNSLIGFGLLIVLLIGYIVYNQRAESQYQAKVKQDSIAYRKAHPELNIVKKDTVSQAKPFASASDSLPEQFITLENDDLSVTFTNKGGYATKALLKKYKTFDGKPLLLFDGKKNYLDISFLSNAGTMEHSKSYTMNSEVSNDKKSIRFTHANMDVTYTLPDHGYMMNMTVNPSQASKSRNLDMEWSQHALMTEQNTKAQKQYIQLCYNLENEGYDYLTIRDKNTKEMKEGVKWVCFKQHYFNSSLITDHKIITSARVTTEPNSDTTQPTQSMVNAYLSVTPQGPLNFKWFLGPNDYSLLKSYRIELENIIPLSYGIFGFVKYINTWIIIPIFNGLSKIFSSYGIVILMLTFIIRLLMSPFTYKSYVSSAKMKALKPELDELKSKYGDDKQAFGVEQMKLYREAGVNPLGGCLPALLQLPVFFALLSFFPHAIELRQEKFLWAKDLSTYDSILKLPFNIPLYGDHISLFTILFVVTSLILALYSMNMNVGADQSNPMLKYMPFIMPVMFLGIFNDLPAALTFYYFVSNVITLIIQYVIQNFIINPDKIHAQIQAKRNEPPKESKLMKRMMEIQQQNQERMKNAKK